MQKKSTSPSVITRAIDARSTISFYQAPADTMASTATIGCLLDVSGSMREALETGRPGEGAIERLQAVLRAALQLAQTEKERDPNARMFVAAFGLNEETKCPPVVDLCSVVATLLDGRGDNRTGHDLLIGLANQHNLDHISQYIRTKLSDDEARIVYAHMRRHPERVTEFVNAIPKAGEMRNRRVQGRVGGAIAGAWLAMAALGPLGLMSGVLAGAAVANVGVEAVEDRAVERSDALKLARGIWDEWWLECAELVPRSVAEVVDLLQRLQDHPSTRDSSRDEGGTLLDMIRRYMYGWTPMKKAMEKSLAVFVRAPATHKRVLVLISDGHSTDGDPSPVARELQQQKITIAAVYLTANQAFSVRHLHDRPVDNWNEGQRTLFGMTSRVAGTTHPIPVLASTGWQVPSSGECALYTTTCTSELLEEFCSALLSARFSSADVLLDLLGRVELDSFINDQHVLTCRNPSNQGQSAVCYAHAIAAALHMALVRIVGRAGGYPTIPEIRTRILQAFPPLAGGGRAPEEVLRAATVWYRPLRFRKVDEEGARQAVLHRRPVLTTFRLSDPRWDRFSQHFQHGATTAKTVLKREHMAPYRGWPDGGGHAVVLVKCGPGSLTFLNSWGRQWGDNGTFSVEDHTVLQLDRPSGPSPVNFYDVYWLESELSSQEQQAYIDKADDAFRTRSEQVPGLLQFEARCPHCRTNSSVAHFRGSIRRAVCPRCYRSFAPQPGHLMQALYTRAGLDDLP